MRTSKLFAFGLAISLVACGPGGRSDDTGGDDGLGDDGGGDDGGGDDMPPPPPAARCEAMDIVFVVDDSGSMAEEQSSLATNFPQFAAVLDSYEVAPGQLLDYRVALTTTGRTITTSNEVPGFPPIVISEQGDNGAFRDTCGSPKRWIDRTDGNLNQTLSCRAQVGTSGPGAAEMSLYMPMMALSDRITDGTNAGFLRDDALLAIVIITDEDDCSRTDDNITVPFANPQSVCNGSGPPHIGPSDTIQFFDALKGDRGRWAAAVVAGPTACTSAYGEAAEAFRLKQFVSEMNMGSNAQNGVFSSICDANMAASLEAALDTFQAACESFPPIE